MRSARPASMSPGGRPRHVHRWIGQSRPAAGPRSLLRADPSARRLPDRTGRRRRARRADRSPSGRHPTAGNRTGPKGCPPSLAVGPSGPGLCPAPALTFLERFGIEDEELRHVRAITGLDPASEEQHHSSDGISSGSRESSRSAMNSIARRYCARVIAPAAGSSRSAVDNPAATAVMAVVVGPASRPGITPATGCAVRPAPDFRCFVRHRVVTHGCRLEVAAGRVRRAGPRVVRPVVRVRSAAPAR